MRVRTGWLMLTSLVFLIDTHPVFGEGSKGSVSVTYTVLRDTELEFTFSEGMSIDGAYRVGPWVYVAAEAAFNVHHEGLRRNARWHLRVPIPVNPGWATRIATHRPGSTLRSTAGWDDPPGHRGEPAR